MLEKTQRKVPNVDVDAHAGGQEEAPGDVSLAIELNTKSLADSLHDSTAPRMEATELSR